MELEEHIKLSDKYKFFLTQMNNRFEFLEGPSATGKTTIGAGIKFILKVLMSKKKIHIIAGLDTGTIEKNIISSEFGILKIWGKRIRFYPKGKGDLNLPHLVINWGGKEKIIIILGYDTESRWKKALGGQYGCVYIDEMVIAPMSFIRQIFMRCDYLLGTSNPNNPDLPIYKEYINRCRPAPECVGDAPAELEEMLNEPAEEGWVWWYFDLSDNDGLSEEKKEMIRKSHSVGTADYMYYVLGLRGKAEGIIFDNFDRKKHTRNEKEIIKFLDKKNEEYFIQFSAGLDTAYSEKTDDTIAMSFVGITNKRNLYILDEEVYNNKDSKIVYAPSIIAEKYHKFLEKNRNKWGFAQNVFIDSADQATISEIKIYANKKGLIYSFNNAWKKLKIIDRIQLQKGWIATDNFYVLDNCENYLHELSVYSWSEKENRMIPEDKNDHMINSVQYAWIPYKDKIGTIQGDK